MRLLLTACALLVTAASLARAQPNAPKSGELVGPRPGSLWFLLLREEVKTDLGTSDDVASKLKSLHDNSQAALQKEYQDAGINPRDIFNPTADQRQKSSVIGKKIDDEFSAKAKELLTADQNKRLRQIQLQYRLALSGPTGLLAPDVAADLKLTDDQRQTLQTLRGEFVRNLLPRGGGNDREAVEKNRQNQELVTTKAIDVLTKEQKETLDKLKGSAFDFSNFLLAMVAAPAKAPPKDENLIESGRIHPDFIVTLAANAAVQKDLGVGDEVARKLMLLLRRDYPPAELKAFEEAGAGGIQGKMQMMIRQRPKHDAIVKKVQEDFLPKLQETLPADQFQRLFQIQFQNALNHDGPRALLAPELAEDLKLIDEQKMRLNALGKEFAIGLVPIRGRAPFSMSAWVTYGKEYRTKAIELLTAEQKGAVSKLEGKEFDLAPLVSMSRPLPPR